MPQSITVPAGMVGTGMVTLAANDVCTVTFADNIGAVDVISDGTAEVWYTTNGVTPTVAGQMCWRLPAGSMFAATVYLSTSVSLPIKFISSGSAVLTVQRA